VPRTDDVFVFPGRRIGTPVSAATIWAWVRLVAEEAGLPPVPCHVLRHTCLSTANDATGDLRAVQALAGHIKVETTTRYTRLSRRRLEGAVMALDY
jgi:integrase